MVIITSFYIIICFLCFTISTIPSPFMICCFLLVAVSILVQLRPSCCCCFSLSVNCPFHFHTTHTFISLPPVFLLLPADVALRWSYQVWFLPGWWNRLSSIGCTRMIFEDWVKSQGSLLTPYIELLKIYKRTTITFFLFSSFAFSCCVIICYMLIRAILVISLNLLSIAKLYIFLYVSLNTIVSKWLFYRFLIILHVTD